MKLFQRIDSAIPYARFLLLASILSAGSGCEMFELEHVDSPAPEADAITNGTPTNYDSWKGVVGVVWMVDGYGPVACSGTLIAPNVVLTAGHCVWSISGGTDFRAAPEELEIRGGADVYTDGDWFHLADVQEAIVHPDWNGNLITEGPDISVDIGMLLLTEDITTIEHHQLWHPPAPIVGTIATIVGYGNSIDGDYTTQGVHRMGTTTVLEITENFIQVGDPCGLCHGDSGGGMFIEQGGEQILTGVNSWGESGICNPLMDTWATNIGTYVDDIEDVLNYWNPPVEPDAGPDGGDLDVDTDSDSDSDLDSDSDSDSDTDDDGIDPENDSCGCTVPGHTARARIGLLFALLLVS